MESFPFSEMLTTVESLPEIVNVYQKITRGYLISRQTILEFFCAGNYCHFVTYKCIMKVIYIAFIIFLARFSWSWTGNSR